MSQKSCFKFVRLQFHPKEILKRIDRLHEALGSWDKVARALHQNRRSLLRWRKTGKMRQNTMRALDGMLKSNKFWFDADYLKKVAPSQKIVETVDENDGI